MLATLQFGRHQVHIDGIWQLQHTSVLQWSLCSCNDVCLSVSIAKLCCHVVDMLLHSLFGDVKHCTTNQIQCSVYPVYCGTLSFHVLLWLCTWNEPWGTRSQSAESSTVDSCYSDDSPVSPLSAGQAASQPQCLSATSVRHRCKLSLLTNRHSSTYRTLGVPLAHTPDWLSGWLAGWLTADDIRLWNIMSAIFCVHSLV